MTVLLVRHARAGSRSSWSGDDDLRPLSNAGRRQADALVELLERYPIERIVSSSFVRCRQSVQPLAEHLRLPVLLDGALVEGATADDALALFDRHSGEVVVCCSHGDVIGEVLAHLERSGVALDDHRMEKASTWVLERADGTWLSARHLPPPD